MDLNYWVIETWDKELIEVKPDPETINAIKKAIASQQGSISTATRSIVVKNIKDFRLSDKPFIERKLIEDVNRIFGEPEITANGVKARWMKRSVPKRRWDMYYSAIPGYVALQENEGFVSMAVVVPVHQIDHERVQELTPGELLRVSKY